MITYEQVKKDEKIRTYVECADKALASLGFTEHSFAHVTKVAENAGMILRTLGFSEEDVNLEKIAGFMHDIGNIINRTDHSQSGALISFRLLDEMGMDAESCAKIMTAIGNHDEGYGEPVSPYAAALIIADKSDVRRSRVRELSKIKSEVHDAVNYSVTASELSFSDDNKSIILRMEIDTEYASVLDFFDIFTERMLLCRKSASTLGVTFKLYVNGQRLI